MKSGVYKIHFSNDDRRRVYIGISNNLSRRKNDHLVNLINYTHKNKYLQSAFNKFGKDFYVFEILESCSVEDMVAKESEYIIKYNSFNNKFGYNLTSGGEHFKLSDSTKKKLSIAKSGRKLSEETKIKLVIANLLKTRPELKIDVIDGKIFVDGKDYKRSTSGRFRTPSDDEILKIKLDKKSKWQSEFAKNMATNRVKSKEEIEKIRLANIGRKSSNETKAKIGSYHIGKKISDNHKEGIKEKLGHKVILSKDGVDILFFKSKKECAKYFFVSDKTIGRYYKSNKQIKDFDIKINNHA
jgi:group I intron endonuclease